VAKLTGISESTAKRLKKEFSIWKEDFAPSKLRTIFHFEHIANIL
jgi:hypothetical protein